MRKIVNSIVAGKRDIKKRGEEDMTGSEEGMH